MCVYESRRERVREEERESEEERERAGKCKYVRECDRKKAQARW